jgi:hypothetical protein
MGCRFVPPGSGISVANLDGGLHHFKALDLFAVGLAPNILFVRSSARQQGLGILEYSTSGVEQNTV